MSRTYKHIAYGKYKRQVVKPPFRGVEAPIHYWSWYRLHRHFESYSWCVKCPKWHCNHGTYNQPYDHWYSGYYKHMDWLRHHYKQQIQLSLGRGEFDVVLDSHKTYWDYKH